MSWAHWNNVFEDDFEADDDLGCVSKMYVAEASSGDVELAYLGYIQRESLIPEVSCCTFIDNSTVGWMPTEGREGTPVVDYSVLECIAL